MITLIISQGTSNHYIHYGFIYWLVSGLINQSIGTLQKPNRPYWSDLYKHTEPKGFYVTSKYSHLGSCSYKVWHLCLGSYWNGTTWCSVVWGTDCVNRNILGSNPAVDLHYTSFPPPLSLLSHYSLTADSLSSWIDKWPGHYERKWGSTVVQWLVLCAALASSHNPKPCRSTGDYILSIWEWMVVVSTEVGPRIHYQGCQLKKYRLRDWTDTIHHTKHHNYCKIIFWSVTSYVSQKFPSFTGWTL